MSLPDHGRVGAVPSAGPGLPLERIDDVRWRIPRSAVPGMRVDGLVFADDRLIEPLRTDPALRQVANVAMLPGIVGRSLAMPDVHWGYGFPVGGVAATRLEDGVISPGGIGFDINCGVRLLRSDLTEVQVRSRAQPLADALFGAVPSGVGAATGVRLSGSDMEAVLLRGAGWAVERGFGTSDDLETTEETGRLAAADPAEVSTRARGRGSEQLGTLGSGNHFLEVGVVERLEDAAIAAALGLARGTVTILIHCGSRGLGHQVCTDHVAVMDRVTRRYGIELPDRQLACVPLGSAEGRAYLGAMAAAANFAWANRQVIVASVRSALDRVFGAGRSGLGLRQVYDVSHNLAKMERHRVDGTDLTVCVHRKGATRAFPRGHADVPERYRDVGQPVLIPGDMGRASWVAVGGPGSMTEAFGSTCHGAGRAMSRHAAVRAERGVDVAAALASRGILVRARERGLLAEEASLAYKNVDDVVSVAARAGLIIPVARLRPLVVVKG